MRLMLTAGLLRCSPYTPHAVAMFRRRPAVGKAASVSVTEIPVTRHAADITIHTYRRNCNGGQGAGVLNSTTRGGGGVTRACHVCHESMVQHRDAQYAIRSIRGTVLYRTVLRQYVVRYTLLRGTSTCPKYVQVHCTVHDALLF
jgi:hypothetical protein